MRKEYVSSVVEGSHRLMNETVVGTAGLMEGAYLAHKLDERLKERGITQKQLADMTGMRVGTISDLVNGKQGISINIVQTVAIMVALRITDMSELIEIRLPDELKTKYESQSHDWVSTKEMPIEVKEMYRNNVLKANNL